MLKNAIASIMLAAGTLAFAPNPAHADSPDLTKTLQEMVAQLSPEQQQGLVLLLSGLTADDAAVPAPQSAKDALIESLTQFNEMGADGGVTLEPFYARISEDFQHWAVGGKSGAVNWLGSMKPMLIHDGKSQIEFNLNSMEVNEDGDTAIARSINVNTPFGSAIVTIHGKREADGVWRIVSIDGL